MVARQTSPEPSNQETPRAMIAKPLVGFCVLAGVMGGLVGWTRHRSSLSGGLAPSSTVILEPETHKVTPRMLRDAEALQARDAPAFHVQDDRGCWHDLAEERADGPVVLIFISDGCPCSVSAEPYWNSLHAAYNGRIRFLGVIDGDAAVARAWGTHNGVPFPILPDPRGQIIRSYGAENSAYVALIDREGRIDAFWPGYSSAMLSALNGRIAQLAGLAESSFDVSDAPEELYSGCPFAEFPPS